VTPESHLLLPARPEPLSLNPAETAVIVVDMQNAYASIGGYCDLAGFDIAGAADTISRIGEVLNASRTAGIQIVYLQNGWDPDYVEAGTDRSPNYHKSNALKTMRRRSELAGQLLSRGRWDYEIVEALAPRPGDIRVHKTRYSAFFNSQLDSILRCRSIRNLVFVGIATNVCVESTLRDGFHLEYFGVVLDDATHHLGPDFVRAASIYNIETFFGWVATTGDYLAALQSPSPSANDSSTGA